MKYRDFVLNEACNTGVPASSGTVMLAAMPTLVGTQLLLAFVGTDMASTPRRSIQARLSAFALEIPEERQ